MSGISRTADRSYRQDKPRRNDTKKGSPWEPEIMLASAVIEKAFEDLRKWPVTYVAWKSAARFLLMKDSNLEWMASGVGVDVHIIRKQAAIIAKERWEDHERPQEA